MMRESAGVSCATTNWGVRISWLGYSLYRGSVDSFGRRWAYRTFPQGSGSIGQFSSLRELVARVRDIEKMRAIDNHVLHNEHIWSRA